MKVTIYVIYNLVLRSKGFPCYKFEEPSAEEFFEYARRKTEKEQMTNLSEGKIRVFIDRIGPNLRYLKQLKERACDNDNMFNGNVFSSNCLGWMDAAIECEVDSVKSILTEREKDCCLLILEEVKKSFLQVKSFVDDPNRKVLTSGTDLQRQAFRILAKAHILRAITPNGKNFVIYSSLARTIMTTRFKEVTHTLFNVTQFVD
jgi:hypothetical protein